MTTISQLRMSPDKLAACRRGLAIHAIQTGWEFRHKLDRSSEERTQLVAIIRDGVKTLRGLGPGPVSAPPPIRGSVRTPKITWWGPK